MAASENLISLVYLSQAVLPFLQRDLTELLTRSRQNNTALGISGMLLFKDGNFLQVLEGERQTVLDLYKKIGKDPRHWKLTSISQVSTQSRDFPDWSMGFRDLNSARHPRPAGYSDFLDTSLTLADFASDPGRAKKLLLLFKEDKLLSR